MVAANAAARSLADAPPALPLLALRWTLSSFWQLEAAPLKYRAVHRPELVPAVVDAKPPELAVREGAEDCDTRGHRHEEHEPHSEHVPPVGEDGGKCVWGVEWALRISSVSATRAVPRDAGDTPKPRAWVLATRLRPTCHL